jgi:hypothetical protein
MISLAVNMHTGKASSKGQFCCHPGYRAVSKGADEGGANLIEIHNSATNLN